MQGFSHLLKRKVAAQRCLVSLDLLLSIVLLDWRLILIRVCFWKLHLSSDLLSLAMDYLAQSTNMSLHLSCAVQHVSTLEQELVF